MISIKINYDKLAAVNRIESFSLWRIAHHYHWAQRAQLMSWENHKEASLPLHQSTTIHSARQPGDFSP